MDMKKILENMDSAVAGNKPSTAQKDVNDMKTILESLQECGGMEEGGMMPPMEQPEDKVTMNVSLNARGIDAIDELITLMGGKQNTHVDMPMAHDAMHTDVHSHNPEMEIEMPSNGEEMDMATMRAIMAAGEKASDEPEMDDDMEEEWDNAPDEEYSDHNKMTKDLSGGINREKKAYAKAQDGDNAMAVENLKAELSKALREKMDPVGQEDDDINNDGKEDDTDEYLKKRREKIAQATAADEKVGEGRGRGRGRGKKK